MIEYKSNIKEFTLKKNDTEYKKVKINSSNDGQKYARNFYYDDLEIYESFFIIILNRANNTIGYAKISQGGITGTVVNTKILLKYAIESLASGIILVHNHPSGQKFPSNQDKELTNKLSQAFKIIEINLLDHIILTKDTYFSFADDGLI